MLLGHGGPLLLEVVHERGQELDGIGGIDAVPLGMI